MVASEVKALAAQTARATEDIGPQVAAIQNVTKITVEAIGIGTTVRSVNEVATIIAAAVEEQAATTEIARNVQEASAGTAEVSPSSPALPKLPSTAATTPPACSPRPVTSAVNPWLCSARSRHS